MAKSKWKSPYIDIELLKKIYLLNLKKKNRVVYTMSRNTTICSNFVNYTFYVHRGNKFNKIFITKEMIGKKLGEFSFTRKIGFIHRIKNQKKKIKK